MLTSLTVRLDSVADPGFANGGTIGERAERELKRGPGRLGAEPTAGSRGRARPGGVRGRASESLVHFHTKVDKS